MLEFWKDGMKQELKAISSNGKVGQVVVLTHVVLSEENIFYKYPQPALFTIKEKIEGKDGFYMLLDSKNELIKWHEDFYGAYSYYLYDAQEWALFVKDEQEQKRKDFICKCSDLEKSIELLKSILIAQGVKLVTQEQLDAIGLKLY